MTLRSNRRENFKKGIDSELSRRRRDDTRIKLRKEKKEENLQKRRAMTSTPNIIEQSEVNSTQGPSTGAIKKTYGVEDIPSLMQLIRKQGATEDEVLNAVSGFRKILSVEHDPPVTAILECGIMPILVQLLSADGSEKSEKIQFEAAWALTNVASTDQTQAVVSYGALEPLVKMLMSGNADCRDQAIWCLGNIAGDSYSLRDSVLENGALPALLQNVTQPATDSLLGNAVWALSNFCRGKPQVNMNAIAPAVPVLATILKNDNIPRNVIVDACWALSYLSDGDDDRIQAIMNTGVTATLINLLSCAEAKIITPCVRTLGNFVSGNDKQTQAVLDAGIMECIDKLLTHSKRTIRKESHWLLSNIAAGTVIQIDQLARHQKILEIVVDSAKNGEWEVRKEAIWVLSNMCGGTDKHINLLVQMNGIEALSSVLQVSDPRIVIVAMDAIDKILSVGEKLGYSAYPTYVDECGGLDELEELQSHENEEVYEKALHILDTYFGSEEQDDENLLPQTDGNQFVFGHAPAGKSLDENADMNNAAAAPLQQFNFQFGN